MGCSAVGCINRAEKGYRMFRFPWNKERRKMWEVKVNREKWTPTDSSCLCEVHFEESQFEQNRVDGLRKLKQNAVPTIFPPSKKKISKRKATLESKQVNGQQQKQDPKAQISSLDCVRPSSAQLDQLTKQLPIVVLNKPSDETVTQLVQAKDGGGRKDFQRRGLVELDIFLSSLRLSSLPAGWVWPDRKQPSFAYLHRCKGEGYRQWTVTRQVDLSDDATYTLLIHGRPVSPERFPAEWPPFVDSSEALSALLGSVSEARICAGNPEEEFCRLVAGAVPEDAWDSHAMTVRASGCHLLSTEWYQCSPCQELRERLHRIVDDNCLGICAPVPLLKVPGRPSATVKSGTPLATVDARGQPERLPFTLTPTKDSEIVFDESSANSTSGNREMRDSVLMQTLPFIVRHSLENMTADELKEPVVVRKIVQSVGGVKKDEKVYLIKDIATFLEDASGS